MSKIQKLELTWVGKDEKEEIEPRILVENPELSHIYNRDKNGQLSLINKDGDFDNMLIHGDNLLALKALEQDFAGKVKCIYIDPPYNTGSAFEHYDDNLEHSIWLNLMRSRLEILYNLLSKDGMIFVQIDDNEQAYLTVLMDEIFGRENHINTICVNMSNMSGVKVTAAYNGKRFPKIKEYILLYVKDCSNYSLKIPKQKKDKWDSEYNYIIPELTEDDYNNLKCNNYSTIYAKIDTLKLVSLKDFAKTLGLDINRDDWKYDNSYRIVATKPNSALLSRCNELSFNSDIALVTTSQGLTKLITTKYNKDTKTARIELVFAKDTSETFFGDHWDDIVTTGGVGQEGGVEFKNSKKPEKLVARIISSATNENDTILDSFLGSGTTCAVAHKMKRKWIGIEMGEHAYTHCKLRLDNIIDGKDQTGISKTVNWQGGGSYKFYELAPSLVVKDSHGREIINPEYNANMLAAAMAKHEGFKYNPDRNNAYKQGFASEKSFIFTTTNHITAEYLDEIASNFADDEYLIINCKSFDGNIVNNYNNITIKKIPQSVLGKCVFNKDNYNLNIINLPVEDDNAEE